MANGLGNYAKAAKNPPVSVLSRNDQVQNSGGGFSFQVSDKVRLERFLILGIDGGTYYVKEVDLAKQNVDFLRNLIKKDENFVLNTTVEISKTGRAYRNDSAIFVMALLLAEGKNKADTVAAIPLVVRTGTHVYALASYITSLGGWGRAKRDAVANWLTSQSPEQLAYQAVKYQGRTIAGERWTMRDLMRKSHPKGLNKDVGDFILHGPENIIASAPDILHGFATVQAAMNVDDVLYALNRYSNLPWETIPTQYLKDPKVWKKLFENGQLKGQALVRQITRLAKLGMFDDMGFAREYANALTDQNMISKTRLHPMQYLNAYVVYTQGQIRGNGGYWNGVERIKDWSTSGIIKDALDDGFFHSFGNVEPSDKYMMISVDVSSSMSWHAAGSSNFTAAQAAGAMALVTAKSEPYYTINGFSSGLVDLGISSRTSIDSAFSKVQNQNFGSTNLSAPMQHALQRNIPVDAFVVITDNEVNQGYHAHNVLKDYRNKTGIPARMVVMGMASNGFTVADPLDAGMLDVVGFDTNTPQVVSDFSAGRI